ncbi:MAG: transposase [Verrucomicrobiales bacterium]|nr:transposase [Nitrospira sp.]
MTLWIEWLQAVRSLRPACSRSHTFFWLVLVLMGLCCRADNAGVTSFVRVLNFRGEAYHRFLHLFHSKGLDLDALTACWVRLCLALFQPFQVASRIVVLADGIKAPKEGKRMPAVKLLHQQSASNSKPEYIMGHSLQAISLLVHGPAGQVAAVPLTSRIHEGLVFSNRDARTLLDKLVALLFSITRVWDRQVVLVADAYYASGKVIRPLLAKGHHLVTRAKSNAVAYSPAPAAPRGGKGRPRFYGDKVSLKDLAKDDAAFSSAPSPVYGENDVTVRYRCVDLLWRPVAHLVRFVIVHHPIRGTIFLLCTDLSLAPLEILQLYGYRFKIELGFRQAVHVLGAYAYHFWMLGMKPLRRGDGDQYLHRTSDSYRAAIRRKLRAYHVHVQLGCIAQGLLQHLSLNFTAEVWRCFRSWLRTMNPALPPSELIVANALRTAIPAFFTFPHLDANLKKIVAKYHRYDLGLDAPRMVA